MASVHPCKNGAFRVEAVKSSNSGYTLRRLTASRVSQFYFLLNGFHVKTINLLMYCRHCSTTFEWGLRLTARARKNYGV